MHDMGLMRKKPDIAVSKVDETKHKYYPGINLNEEQMPMLKGKKLGDKFKCEMEFEIKGMREANEWSDSKTPSYDLEMKKCSGNED